MQRDLEKFPDDDNGNVLWKLASLGLDVEGEREVRFALLFPSHESALKFGVFLLRHEYRVKVNELDDKPGYLGEVLVDIFMDSTHREITEAEEWLAENSSPLQAKNDGWELQPKRGKSIASTWCALDS
jgi:hypothetical protein